MDQMYTMGLSIHSAVTGMMFLAILLNVAVVKKYEELKKFRRIRTLFLAPFYSMVIGAVVFTGTIMMAAKHLDFTVENVVMIVLSLYLIFAEVSRTKILKYTTTEEQFQSYKRVVYKSSVVEFVAVLLVSLWMWL